MARKEQPREEQPSGGRTDNGESSIYYGADGYWHGRVTMGIRDDGTPDRRHIRRKAGSAGKDDHKVEAVVIKLVRDLEKERDNGTARKTGPKWTVEKWLRHWVEEIAAPTVRYKTITTYRANVYKHLIPGIGAHRLEGSSPNTSKSCTRG